MIIPVQLHTKIRRKRSMVSLTPLIDIIFILLLFFMLTTQFNRLQGTTIAVEAGLSSTAATEENNTLQLLLFPDGQISINDQPPVAIKTQSFEQTIADALNADTRLVLNIDDAATLQQMTELLDTLHQLDVPEDSLKVNL